MRRGRELSHLPECASAWERGEITGAHLDVMASLRTGATEEALARDEGLLVGEACRLRFDQFLAAVAYWRQRADPDGAEGEAERRRARRDVYLVKSFSWTVAGPDDPRPRLGHHRGRRARPPGAASCSRPTGPRPAHDWGESPAGPTWPAPRASAGPTPWWRWPPARSTAPRRRTPSRPPVHRAGGLGDAARADLPSWRTAPWCPPGPSCRGWRSPTWSGRCSPPGRRVEISPTSRLFTGATRRAIEVRDQECTHPTCDVTASRCQVDHIRPWALGGPTTQENGRLLCGYHNRLRNRADQNPRPPPRE